MISKAMLSLLLVAAAAAPASTAVPKAGYGFNWLSTKSQCRKLTAKDLATLKRCEVNTNAFGLDLKAHTCKVSDKVEWIIYDTAAQCKEAWETSQANGD